MSEILPKLPAEFKAKWVEALRSGKYQQGQKKLIDDAGYCCLGVGGIVCGLTNEEMAGKDYLGDAGLDFDKIPAAARHPAIQYHLSMMNDHYGKSFNEIADWIEQNL